MSSSRNIVPEQRADAFLAQHRQPATQQQFEELAAMVKQDCEYILEYIHVKGIVTCRTKKYDSLEKKVHGMLRDDVEFRQWVASGNDIYQHHEMGDLAGVRFGLYLPNDVVRVVKELQKRYEIKHLFGTVTGGRDAVQGGRNLDIEKHGDGPWSDGDDRWEHYGYKSWQMVVAWKRSSVRGLASPRVEIQVGTVVTQAWAEIQHNIIYKRPDEILATPTMKRMIDAVNGLAITTEIMLRELDRSLEVAKKEAAVRLFDGTFHFPDWFRSTYLDKMRPEERQRWMYPPTLGHFLCSWGCKEARRDDMSRYQAPSPDPAHVIRACPAVYKKLIQQEGLLETRSRIGQPLDISVLILKAAGYVFAEGNAIPVSWKQPEDKIHFLLQGTEYKGPGKWEQFV